MKELHPLYETPVEQVLPWVFCCLRCCRKKDQVHMKLAAEDDEEIREIDERLDNIVKNCGG